MSSDVIWIAREAEGHIEELLAGDAPIVTVHGLGGAGSSALVRRALARRRHEVVRASALVPGARAPRLRGALVFVDDVHDARGAARAIGALARGGARVVVAAREPLGLPDEARVPLGLLDERGARALFRAELRRLGRPLTEPTDEVIHAVGGWPILVRSAAEATAAFGPDALAQRGVLDVAADERCRRTVRAAQGGLTADARRLLVWLSATAAGADASGAVSSGRGVRAALARLVDLGLVVRGDGRARVPAPVAWLVLEALDRRARARAVSAARRAVVRDAEARAARFRREPAEAARVLGALARDLVAAATEGAAASRVRATLALEPLLVGHLDRELALGLLQGATRAAAAVGPLALSRIGLAHARALISRGDHETAETLLRQHRARDLAFLVYRDVYLGHIHAWRGEIDEASRALDAAAARLVRLGARLADEAVADVGEDILLQRVFVAFQRGDDREASRLARELRRSAALRGSARMTALARRFVAEVWLRQGRASDAVPLLEATRDELFAYGDRAGGLFVWSRVVEALRQSDAAARAREEARAAHALAARTGEGTMELGFVHALTPADVSAARVAELAWQTQIQSLRRDAQRWLEQSPSAVPPLVLHLDDATREGRIGGREASFARRPTLFRVLAALVEAHLRARELRAPELFARGWPGEHATSTSKKKRVQTAIWTLRRLLLGDALRTLPHGYGLAPHVRVSRVHGEG